MDNQFQKAEVAQHQRQVNVSLGDRQLNLQKEGRQWSYLTRKSYGVERPTVKKLNSDLHTINWSVPHSPIRYNEYQDSLNCNRLRTSNDQQRKVDIFWKASKVNVGMKQLRQNLALHRYNDEETCKLEDSFDFTTFATKGFLKPVQPNSTLQKQEEPNGQQKKILRRQLDIDKQLLDEMEGLYSQSKVLNRKQPAFINSRLGRRSIDHTSNVPLQHGQHGQKREDQVEPVKELSLLYHRPLLKHKVQSQQVTPKRQLFSRGETPQNFINTLFSTEVKHLQQEGKDSSRIREWHKEFKGRLTVTKDTLEQELDLNYKLYEQRQNDQVQRDLSDSQTQSLVEGTFLLVREQFEELLHSQSTNAREQCIQLCINEQLNLTKNFRSLIRMMDQTSQGKSYQQEAALSLSLFWKALSLNFDFTLQNRAASLNSLKSSHAQQYEQAVNGLNVQIKTLQFQLQRQEEHSKQQTLEMQKTIDKLAKDKKQLNEVIRDKENDLQKLNDPKHLQELKSFLNELEGNITELDEEKNVQYQQMQHLLGMMAGYKKPTLINERTPMHTLNPIRKSKRRIQVDDIEVQKGEGPQNPIPSPLINVNKNSECLKSPNVKENRRSSAACDVREGMSSSMMISQSQVSKENTPNNGEVTPTHLVVNIKGYEVNLFEEYQKLQQALKREAQLLLELKEIKQWQEQQNQLSLKQSKSQPGLSMTEIVTNQKIERSISVIQEEIGSLNRGIKADCLILQGEKVNQYVQTDCQSSGSRQGQKTAGNSSQTLGAFYKQFGALGDTQQDSSFAKENQSKPSVNPIVKAIQGAFQQPKAGYDVKAKATEQAILKIMDMSMEEKVKADLDNEMLDYDQRKPQSFASSLYDTVLMQYGLKTIAIKNIVQICNGIKQNKKQPYANYLGRIIGILQPSLEKDQVGIILKCHVFFKEIHTSWLKRVTEKSMPLSILLMCLQICQRQMSVKQLTSRQGENELRNVFKDDKEMCQRILSAIKPSQLNNIDTKNSPALQKLKLEFSLLKITTKIAKMGKDAKFLYDSLDKDKSGSRKTVQRLEFDELLTGLSNDFGIYFSHDETKDFALYLDSDGSGDIDYSEFSQKVNFKVLSGKQNAYTITKVAFIELILGEWDYYKYRERKRVHELFQKYDDNGDGVLTLEEFDTLIKSIEPCLKKKQIVNIFNETLDRMDSLDDSLDSDALYQTMFDNKLGGFGKEFFSDYPKQAKTSLQKRLTIAIKHQTTSAIK